MKPRFCINCAHFHVDHRCYAPELPAQRLDFVTGEPIIAAPFCRDVNVDGRCRHFERLHEPILTRAGKLDGRCRLGRRMAKARKLVEVGK
jgi:hypothetical protein